MLEEENFKLISSENKNYSSIYIYKKNSKVKKIIYTKLGSKYNSKRENKLLFLFNISCLY